MAEAEDKVAVMRKYYGQKEADKDGTSSQCICMVKKIKKKKKLL